MASDLARGGSEPLPISNFYIVEVKNEHETKYVICEKVMVIDHGGGSVPWGDIDAYITQHPLRAAPIPDAGGPFGGRGPGAWNPLASTFTSAGFVVSGLTLNIFPPKEHGS